MHKKVLHNWKISGNLGLLHFKIRPNPKYEILLKLYINNGEKLNSVWWYK